MAVFESQRGAPPRVVFSVAALLLAAGDALAARFSSIAVRGELSGFSRAGSGHCYFTLKDAEGAAALLRCAMFRRAAALLDFDPRDGQQVELRGRIGLYEPRGELQLVVESIRRLGAGGLYEEFLRLRTRLEAEGLFAAERKRPLPVFPRRLAVVTSPQAAAWHDVMTALRRRVPQIEVVLVPSPVQGDEAPLSLVAALQRAAALPGVDLLLLVRGGGSIEDLWAFNDERVVRAVASCARPVICGVGHESDVTLADLAADLRAPTPTAAAELAAPPRADQLQRLARADAELQRAVQRPLERQAQRLDALALKLMPAAAVVAGERARLGTFALRVQAAARAQLPRMLGELTDRHMRMQRHALHAMELCSARLAARADRLAALDPRHVLRRGFVWVEGEQREPILSVRQLSPQSRVRAIWADGTAAARIEAVTPDRASDAPTTAVGSSAAP